MREGIEHEKTFLISSGTFPSYFKHRLSIRNIRINNRKLK